VKSVIIAGSRTVDPTVEEIDQAIINHDPCALLWAPSEWISIVCGMAKGADLAGKRWAEAKGMAVLQRPITPRMVTQHGKYLAPKMRNREMAELADAAILFWDARSGGTADMCIRMVVRDKPVMVVPWRPRPRVKSDHGGRE
jgi:hypothetical protein